jgi:hypothetical protein
LPALFPPFISGLGIYLDAPVQKKEEDTAQYIADLYKVAVSTATISTIPGSSILSLPDEIGIKDGFLEFFEKNKEKNGVLYENLSTLSSEIINFWQNVKWNSTPPPPGLIGPNPAMGNKSGVETTFYGSKEILQQTLYNLFSAPPTPLPSGTIISTGLAGIFASHIYTISGVYNGLITSPTGAPTPSPPVPWSIII